MVPSELPPTYGLLTEQEIRFLDAAVDRLIPGRAGAGRERSRRVVLHRSATAQLVGPHGPMYRSVRGSKARPSRASSRGSRRRRSIASGFRKSRRSAVPVTSGLRSAAAGASGRVTESAGEGEVDLPSMSSKFFFDLLWRNNRGRFFAEPLSGGNRARSAGSLSGFPGVPSSSYREHLDKNEPYRAEPAVFSISSEATRRSMPRFAKHIHDQARRGEVKRDHKNETRRCGSRRQRLSSLDHVDGARETRA